ncbi:putative BRCA1-associated RING domain protein [Operophtera brumata]|uniref:Putative BRCA1-associated RING domain protein n=1 Tax=Operophtera brumata TaxID=104452 RepID=A0A0L7LH26_OPEBR|nr:putative BRCA1-associated RING domain protein [Operophtera brumata]
MSSKSGIENFIQALEAVKQDYTCGVCFELCKEPVTLSKCFHIICSEHFAGLKSCPNCGASLEGCTTFPDERLGSCIDSAKELDMMIASLGSVGKPAVTMPTAGVKHNEQAVKGNVDTSPVMSRSKIGAMNNSKAKLSKSNEKASVSLASTTKFNKAAEKRNNKGETMLHISCRLGKVDQITELLNQGANTNTKDNAGWTPLHEVVQNGRLDLVRLLLQYNTLINVPGQSNETPLHEAVRYGHLEIIEELVKNGADLNIRNCKGETPFQLANANIKNLMLTAADHIVQTQSVNIGRISALYSELDADDIHVYCVSSFRTVHAKLKALIKHHSNLNYEAKFTKKVTHLIVDTEDGMCFSSVDVLQGILSSIWVLSTEWLTKSTNNKLEPFAKYEVKGIGPKIYQGPKNARYNKYKQLPGLFDGCHFYIHSFNTEYEITKRLVVTKPILVKLITDAGGVVLRRVPNPESIPEQEKLVPYHALKGGKLYNCSHYIIFKDMYEPMYNMQHLKALPVGWLIDCMERYELCDP